MNWKKFSIWGITTLLICLFIQMGLKMWINKSLPMFIKEKNDTPYNFNYEQVSYSLWSRQITIDGIAISPKTKKNEAYHIQIKKILIHGVHFFTFLSRKDLIADYIEITKPEILCIQPSDTNTDLKSFKSYRLGKSIQINNLHIKEGKFKSVTSNDHNNIASFENLNIHLNGVVWDMVNKEKRIPVTYKNAQINAEKIFYKINKSHILSLKKFVFENDNLFAKKIYVYSDSTSQGIDKNINTEKTSVNIKVPSAKIKNFDWGYNRGGLFVKTSKIEVDSSQILISTKKNIQRTNTSNYETERILPFNLNIDTILITRSILNLNNHVKSKNINILLSNINNRINEKITIDLVKLFNNYVIIKENINLAFTENSRVGYFFNDLLLINKFTLASTNFDYYDRNNQNILQVKNLNLNINQLKINTLIPENKKIPPLSFASYNISADTVFLSDLQSHSIRAEHIGFSDHNLVTSKVELFPKLSNKNKIIKNLFYIKINSLNINNIQWSNKKNQYFIDVPDIKINQMKADIYQNKTAHNAINSINLNSKKWLINVDKLSVINSSAELFDFDSKKSLSSIQDFDLIIKKIQFTPSNREVTDLPIVFSNFSLRGNNLIFSSGFHISKIKYIYLSNHTFSMNNLTILPDPSKTNYMKKNGIDAYSLFLPETKIINLSAKIINNKFFITVPELPLDKLSLTIHQYDIPDSIYKAVYKPFFSEKLRRLSHKVKIDQISLLNSTINYEEESLNKGTGKINFSNINAVIHNLNNGYPNTIPNDVLVTFKSNFMEQAIFNAEWTFNISDPENKFRVKGYIDDLPAEQVNPFIKPYLHASAEGIFKKVSFDFYGNNEIGHGTFGINYKDLHVTLFNKNGLKEKKLMSSLANLLIINDTKDSLKTLEISETKRSQDKSFFNFLWKMSLNGLKQTLLIF
ncbi:hypothetical protein [Apibacter sp. HY039]|uniref:hypothetical protein n=1 Tax=Apibacter sp. HY039 TaxID=2501476 RepID=UPI000FEBDF1C|nr:hypothetical protein [Apibacter sp. HY039]